MKNISAVIDDLVSPIVLALDLELWGCELVRQGKYSLIRVYIDRESGVDISDCEKVSRQVSAVFDVEEPITEEYTLEVSSPGLERPLFRLEQFRKYVGSIIQLRMKKPQDGRKKFKGDLVRVDDDSIVLSIDGGEVEFQYTDIDKANLIY
ncbi:ribosome maturation factor RimP [Gammaproteobacteria bacterium]|nr:ribosome maturation factor RimP [Gammaproteobacteria bacterium]MDB2444613.1 ribosome maturation factor RimP [Gammaproteobacteria bacterium]